jgi:hypothetical protein
MRRRIHKPNGNTIAPMPNAIRHPNDSSCSGVITNDNHRPTDAPNNDATAWLPLCHEPMSPRRLSDRAADEADRERQQRRHQLLELRAVREERAPDLHGEERICREVVELERVADDGSRHLTARRRRSIGRSIHVPPRIPRGPSGLLFFLKGP